MAPYELGTDDFEVASDPGVPTLQAVLGQGSMAEHLRRVLPERGVRFLEQELPSGSAER